mgnify:CR=1 FL=1
MHACRHDRRVKCIQADGTLVVGHCTAHSTAQDAWLVGNTILRHVSASDALLLVQCNSLRPDKSNAAPTGRHSNAPTSRHSPPPCQQTSISQVSTFTPPLATTTSQISLTHFRSIPQTWQNILSVAPHLICCSPPSWGCQQQQQQQQQQGVVLLLRVPLHGQSLPQSSGLWAHAGRWASAGPHCRSCGEGGTEEARQQQRGMQGSNQTGYEKGHTEVVVSAATPTALLMESSDLRQIGRKQEAPHCTHTAALLTANTHVPLAELRVLTYTYSWVQDTCQPVDKYFLHGMQVSLCRHPVKNLPAQRL